MTVLHYDKYPLYIKPISKDLIDTVALKPLTISLCNSCGYVYQEKPVDSSELSAIYETNYSSYHSPALSGIGSSLAKEFLLFLEKNISLTQKKVLEIGCYDGYFLTLLRDQHVCHVIGCDPSPGAEIAHQMNVAVFKEYYSPGLFKEKFDIVVLRSVLEHIQEPIPFLKEVRCVLKTNGRVVIEVPNVIYSLKNGVIGDFFHEHISYFSNDSLKKCLMQSGFNIVIIDDNSYYIRVIAEKTILDNRQENTDSARMTPMLKQMFEDFNELTENMANDLQSALKQFSGKTIYLYGGGGHTLGLLNKTQNFLKPLGVIDGDPSKEGKYLPGFNIPVYSRTVLDRIDCEKTIVIISSKIFQNEILEILMAYILKGLIIVVLYPTINCLIPKNEIKNITII
ncbi:MAG: class I SAM-dependent methyltransferase [Methanoregula sp.]